MKKAHFSWRYPERAPAFSPRRREKAERCHSTKPNNVRPVKTCGRISPHPACSAPNSPTGCASIPTNWMRFSSERGGEASPVSAWLVRDALDQVVRESGATAPGWRILTDAARIRALGWFPLKEVPPRTV